MASRPRLDDLTDDQLDALYDRLETAETALGYVHALRAVWLAEGPPPLGTSVARWWDTRLLQLNDALRGTTARP